MSRVFGLMVMKNEADRYLEACVRWHLEFLDGLFIYDDWSDDNSWELAQSLGATVVLRPKSVPSFLDHEGAFRQAAWDAFEFVFQPNEDDWVLAIDADEFFMTALGGGERAMLSALVVTAENNNANSVMVHVHELFGEVEETPFIRLDGFWGQIDHPRFFRFQPNGTYWNRQMGGGSAPTYVQPIVVDQYAVLLHCGYYREADRQAKYNRYSSLTESGHNPLHINSIREPPTKTVLWQGKTPWKQ